MHKTSTEIYIIDNETNITKIMMWRYVLNKKKTKIAKNEVDIYVFKRQIEAIIIGAQRNSISSWTK